MIGVDKFGHREAITLLTISSIARIFLSMPRQLVEIAGQSAWLSSVSGLILALLQVMILYLVLKPYPDKNIVEITLSVLGKILGTSFNIVYMVFFIVVAAIFTRTFAETLILSALPRTPISVIIISYILIALVGSYIGLSGLAKSSAITYPVVIVGMLILLLSLITLWDVTRLFPIMGQGAFDVFVRGGLIAGGISEILIAAVIVKSFKGSDPFRKVSLGFVIRSFAWLTFFELVLLLTFYWDVAQELTIPFYNISNQIHIGRYIQRIEAILIVIWGYVSMVKVSLLLYVLTDIFSDTFRLHDRKPLALPFALIVFTVSLLPPDLPTSIEIESTLIRLWAWFPTMVLPLIILIVDRLRNRGKKIETD